MAALTTLLHKLGSDAQLHADAMKNLEEVGKRYGLSHVELAALQSGNCREIQMASGIVETRMSNGTVKWWDRN